MKQPFGGLSGEGIFYDAEAIKKQEEEDEKLKELIFDESKYKAPSVDPFLSEEKEEKEAVPYELEGGEKFKYYSKEMARVYEEQGQLKKAVEIYQLLLRSEPDNEDIAANIRELNQRMSTQEFDMEQFDNQKEHTQKSKAEFIERLNKSLSPDEAAPSKEPDKDEFVEKDKDEDYENQEFFPMMPGDEEAENMLKEEADKLEEEAKKQGNEKNDEDIEEINKETSEDNTPEKNDDSEFAEKDDDDKEEKSDLSGFVQWINKSKKD